MHPGNSSALPNFLISLINNSLPDISWGRIERASARSPFFFSCPFHHFTVFGPLASAVARDDVTRRQGEREGERAREREGRKG